LEVQPVLIRSNALASFAGALAAAGAAETRAAILVLLAFLVTTNALVVFLRRRFERRWQQVETC